MTKFTRALLSGTVLACCAGSVSPALAQGAQSGASSSVEVQDIVVTARRVGERLQNVPVAVTAVSNSTMAALGISTTDNLNAVVPNVAMVTLVGSPTGNAAMIRGIGTFDPSGALDPAVATYIDGVYIGRMTASNTEMADVERIEVLRGPQGTLFGRNTTGGAINIVTRTPSADFGFEQRVTYAELSEIVLNTRLTTGDIGNTGLRASASYLHRQRDGEVNSPDKVGSADPGALNVDGFWARVHGEWGKLTADYSYDLTDGEYRPPAFQIRFTAPRFADYYAQSPSLGGVPLIVQADGRRNDLSYADEGPQTVRTSGHALTLQYEASDALKFKVIAAHRDYKKKGVLPYGPGGLVGMTASGPMPVNLNLSRPNQTQDQDSVEFHIFGEAGDLSYLAGLYYFKENVNEVGLTRFTAISTDLIGTPYNSRTEFTVKSKAKAAFGQLTWRPGWADGRLELTGGLRYSKDVKDFDQVLSIVRSGHASFDNLSYNATLSYKWTPDVMTFARIGSGYRAGGFNPRASASLPTAYKPEKAKVYEIGIKSEFLNRHVRLNATAFYTDYRDLQVSQFAGVTANGTQGLTLNAAADYRGFETELVVVPIPGLNLYSNVGYTDARYKQIYFPNPSSGILENYADSTHFPYTPKWTVANGISYSFSIADVGELTMRLDHTFTTRRWFAASSLSNLSPNNDALSDGPHSLFDARVTLSDIELGSGATGEVSLWADNIFNKEYTVMGIDLVPSLGYAGSVYGIPRRVGVDFRVKM
ncbi:hypothetical protein MB02_11905 [Croceicoccus estronivorus]|uniref:TonB-dependent receptor n=1 Tax=Croceicoccus estronivorus TaxID=1172626 RepID=UPI000832B72A|nr:TonB-dependent receptor [Croceicoccus estronivorus]OCC23330.1 hypothetical protein MB02_11905 [Croceicoccus estronivorus]